MARLSLAKVGLLLLLLALMHSAEAKQKRPQTLRRKKREWILPPAKLLENTDYTHKEFIAKIRSDKDKDAKVEYYLSGPGADKPPFNLFVVDHDTGFVRITNILDREKYPFFNLTGIAKYRDGTTAEDDIPLTITVLDQNDNAPYFELHTGNITEASKEGTFVMQIKGKDDDQAGTINAEISYSIISQEPEGTGHMFTIDKKTGKLYVKEPTLDRETYDFYKLVIKGTDMGGAAEGLTGTGTVEIKVLDINDNIPTLEKSEYSGSVDENVADVVVMRIKALDKDLEHTDNWLTVFTIAKGNEDNLFSIETDKETNEGILKLIKPVDFEEVQNLELGLLIENVTPFVEGGAILMDVDVQVGEGGPLSAGTGAGAGAGAGGGAGVGAGVDLGVDVEMDAGVNMGLDLGLDADLEGGVGLKPEAGLGPGLGVKPGVGPGVGIGLKPGIKPEPGTKPKTDTPAKSYPIKIAVNNVPEGPKFIPETKNIPVSEDPNEAPEDGVITVFAAVDPDTGKPAEDISYAKAYDPDNWFTIDEETAEIKLNKVPDRESPFLVNGTYIAKVLAITKDMPSKTATGTIAIQVTDSNDHCPTLTTIQSSLCSNEKTVYVTGFDEDVSPNAAPFTFRIIPDGTRGSWEVELINETSAAFHSREALWPGSYELQVEVLDAQGLSCLANDIFRVDVCTCVETEHCSLRAARLGTTLSELSAPAIGLLLITGCLILFIPLLLLFCQCGGANTIFPDQFNDLPFDAKEHLMSYHTEGKGEDRVVPLQSVPIMLGMQNKVETAQALNFNNIPAKITEALQTSTFYNEGVLKYQKTRQNLLEVDNAYRFSRESFNHGHGSVTFSRQKLGIQNTTTLYDIALPDAFLSDYYSQKATCAVPVKDSVLECDFEGQGSSAGSVGCCSLLESDNDLQFLNDLGPKFKILAEICSPPSPKPSQTSKIEGVVKTTVDIVKPIVKAKSEHIVETSHTNIHTEKVMPSTNMSKLSVSTVSTAPPSMTLPHSKVTNISHSASLPHAVQSVVLQQPVFYTTSPVPQPMHYVVQPQLQNTVLLAEGAHRAKFSGLYIVSGSQTPSGLVISGPQGSPSGIVTQGTESTKSPKQPSSLTSPVSPTLALPSSPGLFQGSVPVDGWNIIGPNPNGNYIVIKKKNSPVEAEVVDPGSSQGNLPRGAILMKEAVPPQGVLGLAAEGSVYGVTEKGGVVALNTNLGQKRHGQPGQIGLGSAFVLESGVGQLRMGIGHMVAGISPAAICTVGCRKVSVNQFHGIPSSEQTTDTCGIPITCRSDSPKENKTINAIIAAETTKISQPLKEEVVMKTLFKDSAPVQCPVIKKREIEEEPSDDGFTFTSKQGTALDYPNRVVQGVSDNEGMQASEKSSIINLLEIIVETLPGPDVLHKSSEQSDTVVEKPGGRIDGILTDQMNNIPDAPTNKFEDVISLTTEFSDPRENAEEQQENHVLSVGFSDEDKAMGTQMSSTEAFLPGSDVICLISTNKKTDETLEFFQGKVDIVTSNYHSTVDHQIHDNTEESLGRQKAATLNADKEGKGPEGRNSEVGSELQSKEITENQSVIKHKEDVSTTEKVVSDLETNQATVSDCLQTEEKLVEVIVTSDGHGEIKVEQYQPSNSEVGFKTVDDELSTTSSNEIDTVNELEERSIPDQEAIPKQQVNNSECHNLDKGHAQTDTADAEEKASLLTVSTILTNKKEGDLEDQYLTSEVIATQVQVQDSNELTMSTLEHTAPEESSCGHKGEDINNQQNIRSGRGADLDQVNADIYIISEAVFWRKEETQQSFSTTEDQYEDSERQDVLSTSSQMQYRFDNITDEEKDEDVLEDIVSSVEQNISHSNYQDKESTKDDEPHMSSQVDMLMSDDKNVSEQASPVQKNFTITDEQDEEVMRENPSERCLLLLENQLITVTIKYTGEKEEYVAEEVTASIQPHHGLRSGEDAENVISQVADQFISEDNICAAAKEVEEGVFPVQAQQTTCLSDKDENEDCEKDVPHLVSQVEKKLMSGESDGQKEKDNETSPLRIPDVQDEERIKQDPSGTSSYIEEEGIKFHHVLEEDSYT